MSEKMDIVEDEDSIENARLNEDSEILYHQTSEEYDEIFASAQMSVVEGYDIQTKTRICGPSGSGKTTLARSLAFDVAIADKLINEYGLENLWKKSKDEIAVFHHIVTNNTTEKTENGVCPSCEKNSYYERKSKTPTYRCQTCSHEFDEPTYIEESEQTDYYEALENISNINSELKERGLVDDNGEPTEDYPHSQAEAYRDIYKVYSNDDSYPSTPYYEVGMSHAKYAKDLIGHPHIGEKGTTFIKGKISQAVEASRTEPTVVGLDEINRAPTSAKDELYSALDGRVKVSMDEAGGVEIEGNANNLIIVSTMNKGSGHHVEPLDFAEKRRLSDTYYVDFLGVEYPEKEIELIESQTPVSYELAAEIVKTANEIRATASNDGANLSYGAPTGTLMVWAKKAFTNNNVGLSNPVVRAGKSALADNIYDHDESEMASVNSIISKNMDGVDFFANDKEVVENQISETRYRCEDEMEIGCSWNATESEVNKLDKETCINVLEYLSCPECYGGLSEIKPGEN